MGTTVSAVDQAAALFKQNFRLKDRVQDSIMY